MEGESHYAPTFEELTRTLTDTLDGLVSNTATESPSRFPVRWIMFLERPTAIVLQTSGGPCPLLSIVNILLLRNSFSIHPNASSVSLYDILHALLTVLLKSNRRHLQDLQKAADVRVSLNNIVCLLPQLVHGLDVNCQFTSPTAFEYTLGLALFDLLDITLVHAWIVSADDSYFYPIISRYSYNQLLDKVIEWKLQKQDNDVTGVPVNNNPEDAILPSVSQEDSSVTYKTAQTAVLENFKEQADRIENPLSTCTLTHNVKEFDESKKVYFDKNLVDSLNRSSGGDESIVLGCPFEGRLPSFMSIEIEGATAPLETLLSRDSPFLVRNSEEIQQNIELCDSYPETENTIQEQDIGFIAEEYLNQTASQMTLEGFIALHSTVKERQLVSFFRNNHFNVLFRYQNEFYLLVTASSLSEEAVWERLECVPNECTFFTEKFQPILQPESFIHDNYDPINSSRGSNRIHNDYLIARELQNEYAMVPFQNSSTLKKSKCARQTTAGISSKGEDPEKQGVSLKNVPWFNTETNYPFIRLAAKSKKCQKRDIFGAASGMDV
ncbi:hypothetical protein IE077_003017 [Cardiosporidium cionae]|uniref:MINDY deubiquitinase domain-containing protein n=1 Tax=Cardiosporidium cionae TaxID=476202 RepID=A0ABQ7J542_9APIC|nr:hypothetical protein IE077_003017 [Cardiosporidium cionae]|eukprot:KAF8817896.1 hypothetical protein IE077_003017 [Cardiosporidium cionae]